MAYTNNLVMHTCTVCTDGKVHFHGSIDVLLRKVEVCVNGTWTTVCNEC